MISAAVVQTGGSTGTGAGTTTVSAVSGDPWSAPTSGNILLALSVTDNDGATVSINAISGWTRLLSTSNAQMSYALDAKISDGSEAIIAMTVTGTPADRALAVTEWPSTDLDTAIANWQALADESSIASNVTSQATAALTNASANAAVYYVWGIESGHNWDTTLSYTAGTEQVKQTALGNGFRGGNIVATEVVSASASRSSTVSGALSAGKIVGITLVIPGTAVSVTAADGTVQIGEAGLTHAPVAAGTEVFTASPAFSSAINGATLDPDGAAINIASLLSSLSPSSATLTAEDVSAFRVGGAWNAIRWGVDYEIEFTDGTDTARVNCKFTAPVPTRFGAIVTPNATYHPGAAIATDESYGLFTVGEGTHNPADGDTTANIFVAGVATFQPFAYDLSAGNWIEGTAVPFADGAIPECPQQLSNSVLGPLHSPVENFTCLRTY